MSDRHIRTRALLGEDAMKKIFNSSVMVIGAGAVGGQVIETLARTGVGKIIVVDFDVFDETNINRQILATTYSVGKKKVEVAKKRILDINPDCEVKTYDLFVETTNFNIIFDEKPDFVVDAIDSLAAKCELIEFLVKNNIKFISSMGAARKVNPYLIRTANLNKTSHCSLAKQIRKRLKLNGVDLSKVNCIFSTEEPLLTDMTVFDKNQVETSAKKPLGSIATITMMFGLLAADYVIKHIINGSK